MVVVAGNSRKKKGLFTVDERVAVLSEACRPLSNVDITSHHGLLVDVARLVGADVLVRSAGKEHADEKGVAYLNSRGGIPTLLIPSDPATAFISSSQVRSLIAASALSDLSQLVPTSVTARLQAAPLLRVQSPRGEPRKGWEALPYPPLNPPTHSGAPTKYCLRASDPRRERGPRSPRFAGASGRRI